MHKILILGNTGMLGSAVANHFIGNSAYDVTTACRNPSISPVQNSIKFDAISDSFETLPTDFHYIINCIGVIKPFMQKDPVAAIMINSVFPWTLSRWCLAHGIKLIHITTDCVYSGAKGKYIETDLHDALDDYGKSKSLGECVSDAMVLRTSIIGEEIHKFASLISWAKQQKGGEVTGYSTHLWNGLTTKEYAKACDKIIQNSWYKTGLHHIFAEDDVTKLQMMHMFNDKYKLGLSISEAAPSPVDRTLRTNLDLCERLKIPSVQQMISEI